MSANIAFSAGNKIVGASDDRPVVYSIIETPTYYSAISQSSVTNKDVIENQSSTASYDNDFQVLVPSDTRVVSLTPTVCTVDASNTVRRVTSGQGEIEIIRYGVGRKRILRSVSRLGGVTSKTFINYTAGSLAEHINNGTAALLIGKSPSGQTRYSSNGFAGTAIRNPTTIVSSLDISGMTMGASWTDANGVTQYGWQYGCLISPNIIITAAHAYGPYDGHTVYFKSMAGVIESATVVGRYELGEDTRLLKLSANITGCTPFKLLPADYRVKLPCLYGSSYLPSITLSGHSLSEASVDTWIITNLTVNSTAGMTGASNYPPNFTPARGFDIFSKQYSPSKWAIGGDSNHPTFLLINGVLVLVGQQWTPMGFSGYADFQAQIAAAITSLGGTQFTTTNLAAFPTPV